MNRQTLVRIQLPVPSSSAFGLAVLNAKAMTTDSAIVEGLPADLSPGPFPFQQLQKLADAEPGYFWFREDSIGSTREEFFALHAGTISDERGAEIMDRVIAACHHLGMLDVRSDMPYARFNWVRPS